MRALALVLIAAFLNATAFLAVLGGLAASALIPGCELREPERSPATATQAKDLSHLECYRVRGDAAPYDGTRAAQLPRPVLVRRDLPILQHNADSSAPSGDEGDVSSVAFSHDGRLLAWASRCAAHIWDMEEDKEAGVIFTPPYGALEAVAFSPDGSLLASAGFAGEEALSLWNVKTQSLVRILDNDDYAMRLAFSPDGKILASGSFGFGWRQKLRLWDASSGKLLRGSVRGQRWVDALAFSPDGTRLAVIIDGRLRLVDVSTLKERRRLKTPGEVRSVAFSPDGMLIVAGAIDGSIYLWDVATAEVYPKLKGHGGPVWCVTFSLDGKLLASGSEDRTIRVWEVRTGTLRSILRGHTGRVWAAAFSPRGRTLVSGSGDGTVREWDAVCGQESRRIGD